ncbi:spondin domain-containing protein [Litoribaculum gwangyangense]|uniref:Spondin domain-containing protein n=1 Tax=Litoribaculum gwangyangense TaxID=1130722 RepID=A0ABP9CPX5_9FLAO
MKKIILSITISLFFCAISFSQSSANYDISLTTIWNPTDHTSVPNGAHWSPLAGATHKNINDILEFGVIAPISNGIKNIAETGNTSNFMNEINSAINAGKANQYLQQDFSPFAGNNSNASINSVTVSEDFPLITLVSMVAPSPDWFIAINSLNLRSGNDLVNNGWKDTFTLDVYAYDAGTDSGVDYNSPNSVTNPREAITMISGFPVNGNKMATITFTLNSSTLNNNNIETIENVKIYPNPTNGHVTIYNLLNIELSSIEVYTILGKRVKEINVKSKLSFIEMDLIDLNKGVYLLNLKVNKERKKIEKIVIY